MKSITGYIDVAQVCLYLFWIFFAGLVLYLRREDRREGYPLFSESSNGYKDAGFLWIPPPKIFKLAHGGTAMSPSGKPDDRPINAAKVAVWPGAPFEPIGDPMLAAVGPGSYAERADVPDKTVEGDAKTGAVGQADHSLRWHQRPTLDHVIGVPAQQGLAGVADGVARGGDVMGADRKVAGTVKDIWVDRSETIIRYLEVTTNGGRSVLLPMTFASINRNRLEVKVHAILADQFANVPGLANPDQVTLLEEDKICAYYGGGMLYATASRQEPLL